MVFGKMSLKSKLKNALVSLACVGTFLNPTINIENKPKESTSLEEVVDYSPSISLEIPIDNNEAERSIRPFVILRKIMGCLRSEIGMKNYEIMVSLISTW